MIRVHIWHPVATPLDSVVDWARPGIFRRWGHAGLEIRDPDSGASDYFAFWPVDAPDLSVPVHGRPVTSLPLVANFSNPYSVERWLDAVNRWLADPLLAALELPEPAAPPHPSWSRW